MNLPPFLKSLAFWKAVCYVVAVLLVQYVPQLSYITDAILLGVALAVLNLFGIVPELRARGK